MSHKKRTKLNKNSGQIQFINHFGQPLEKYQAYTRATEHLDKKTQTSYYSRLPGFFMYLNEDPDTVIKNRQADITGNDMLTIERYERKVKNYLKVLEEKNLAVQPHLNVIQGFFKNNSRRLRLEMGTLKIAITQKRKKYSPNQDEVKKLIDISESTRDQLIITLMFQNGILPVDLANLKIGDYPHEPWIYYTKARCKTGEPWHGVSTPDCCRLLNKYLKKRGGKIGDPLFISRENNAMSSEAISEVLEVLITRAGFGSVVGFVPKCLRDGFEDALVDAEIYHKVKEAMMGHGSGIEHQYGSARKLEERVVEAMRKVYPLISLTDQPVQVDNEREQKLDLLLKNYDAFIRLAQLMEEGKIVIKD